MIERHLSPDVPAAPRHLTPVLANLRVKTKLRAPAIIEMTTLLPAGNLICGNRLVVFNGTA